MTEEERDAQIGEYVIGTMPAGERAAFEREMTRDAALRAAVTAWEERLAGLADLVPDQVPDPQTWRMIERSLDRITARDLASSAANVDVPDYTGASAAQASIVPLRRSRARWRFAAVLTGSVAAGLALFVAYGLRGQDRASYLAVVNRGGDLPALVVQVDTRAGLVHVRSLAAETPRDHSLQLWYIAPSGGAPRSLGLVDQPRRDAVIPATARSAGLAGATLAVSVEPQGGSPTGGPTGPVIYSGKLIEE